jgi:hypothetical protein
VRAEEASRQDRDTWTICATRGLPWLFGEGFLLMGAFGTTHNYIRLLAAALTPNTCENAGNSGRTQ